MTFHKIAGHANFMGGQAFFDKHHASACIGGVGTIREAGQQIREIAERVTQWCRVTLGNVVAEITLCKSKAQFISGQCPHVISVIDLFM